MVAAAEDKRHSQMRHAETPAHIQLAARILLLAAVVVWDMAEPGLLARLGKRLAEVETPLWLGHSEEHSNRRRQQHRQCILSHAAVG